MGGPIRTEGSLRSRFARLGAWLADHAVALMVASAATLAVAAVYGASAARHLPAGAYRVSGSESEHAEVLAEQRFGVGTADVLALYRDETRDVRSTQFGLGLLDQLEPVMDDPGVVAVTSYFDTAEPDLVSLDGHTALVIVSMAGSSTDKIATYRRIEPQLRAVEPPLEVMVGGRVPADLLAQEVAHQDLRTSERIALPIAALLTLVFFQSAVAALLPVAIGGFALASCAAVLRLANEFTEIAVFALSVGSFLGLGISIDYSLLMVQRFREELGRGRTPREAIAICLDTAGRAVFVSGLAVIVSLAVLIAVPVGLLRSVAIGGVLATAMALIGALLVLPAVLGWLGPRVDRFAVGHPRDRRAASPLWRRVGLLSMRHPVATALGCSVLLVAIGSPVLQMRNVVTDTRMFPHDAEVRLVDEALADPQRFDPGGASAMLMLVKTPGSALEPENLRRLRAFAARVAAVPGVNGVRSAFDQLDPDALSPEALQAAVVTEPTASMLRRTVDDDTALLIARGVHPWRSTAASDVVEAVREVPHPGVDVVIGGPTAELLDLNLTLRDYGEVAAALVVLWNLAVLLVAFRSVAVPIKAVVMTTLSLGASYGLLVWGFQEGHLVHLLRFERLDGIDPTIPLMMFAVVFGLSMDYEVFLLSRIREEWLRTGDNRESVIAGLSYTGRTITSAALILLVVIGAFAAGSLVYVKQIGVGIGAAIALDVTLVRALLVPATMQLLGRWNWWAPRWLRGPTPEASSEDAAPASSGA